MPIYDYCCKECDEVFDELVISSSVPDEEIRCPQCGKNNTKRLLSAPMVSTNRSSSSVSTTSSSGGCGHYGFS